MLIFDAIVIKFGRCFVQCFASDAIVCSKCARHRPNNLYLLKNRKTFQREKNLPLPSITFRVILTLGKENHKGLPFRIHRDYTYSQKDSRIVYS